MKKGGPRTRHNTRRITPREPKPTDLGEARSFLFSRLQSIAFVIVQGGASVSAGIAPGGPVVVQHTHTHTQSEVSRVTPPCKK